MLLKIQCNIMRDLKEWKCEPNSEIVYIWSLKLFLLQWMLSVSWTKSCKKMIPVWQKTCRPADSGLVERHSVGCLSFHNLHGIPHSHWRGVLNNKKKKLPLSCADNTYLIQNFIKVQTFIKLIMLILQVTLCCDA